MQEKADEKRDEKELRRVFKKEKKTRTTFECCQTSLRSKRPRRSKPGGSKELLVSRCFDFSVD